MICLESSQADPAIRMTLAASSMRANVAVSIVSIEPRSQELACRVAVSLPNADAKRRDVRSIHLEPLVICRCPNYFIGTINVPAIRNPLVKYGKKIVAT